MCTLQNEEKKSGSTFVGNLKKKKKKLLSTIFYFSTQGVKCGANQHCEVSN